MLQFVKERDAEGQTRDGRGGGRKKNQEISRGQNLQNLNTMGHSGGTANRLQFSQLSVTITGPVAKGLCGSS